MPGRHVSSKQEASAAVSSRAIHFVFLKKRHMYLVQVAPAEAQETPYIVSSKIGHTYLFRSRSATPYLFQEAPYHISFKKRTQPIKKRHRVQFVFKKRYTMVSRSFVQVSSAHGLAGRALAHMYLVGMSYTVCKLAGRNTKCFTLFAVECLIRVRYRLRLSSAVCRRSVIFVGNHTMCVSLIAGHL